MLLNKGHIYPISDVSCSFFLFDPLRKIVCTYIFFFYLTTHYHLWVQGSYMFILTFLLSIIICMHINIINFNETFSFIDKYSFITVESNYRFKFLSIQQRQTVCILWLSLEHIEQVYFSLRYSTILMETQRSYPFKSLVSRNHMVLDILCKWKLISSRITPIILKCLYLSVP